MHCASPQGRCVINACSLFPHHHLVTFPLGSKMAACVGIFHQSTQMIPPSRTGGQVTKSRPNRFSLLRISCSSRWAQECEICAMKHLCFVPANRCPLSPKAWSPSMSWATSNPSNEFHSGLVSRILFVTRMLWGEQRATLHKYVWLQFFFFFF